MDLVLDNDTLFLVYIEYAVAIDELAAENNETFNVKNDSSFFIRLLFIFFL